jgi:hypothetical protein
MAGVPLRYGVRAWLNKVYWVWRLSPISYPWFALKTWLFLLLNARKTATHLDDCMRAMGLMNHTREEPGMMTMKTQLRGELINRSWQTLPTWKWRDD